MTTQLCHLSNSELLTQLTELVNKEKATTCEILIYLTQVEARGLYRELGHSSLFSFVHEQLGYSEGATYKRITAARFVNNYPKSLELLKRGELNLATLTEIAGVATRENVTELLDKASGKSKREVEKLCCRFRPAETKPIRDSVKSLRRMTAKGLSEQSSPRKAAFGGKQNPIKIVSTRPGESSQAATQAIETTEEIIKITFSAAPSLEAKITEARALLSSKYPAGLSFETLFTEALDCLIENKSPKRRLQRRKARGAKRNKKETTLEGRRRTKRHKTAREAVTLKLRDAVFERDNYCCTFVGPDGQRCGSTWNLQLDHIVPVSKGGKNNASNLRIRCRSHNILEAERIFGRKYMKQFLAMENKIHALTG